MTAQVSTPTGIHLKVPLYFRSSSKYYSFNWHMCHLKVPDNEYSSNTTDMRIWVYVDWILSIMKKQNYRLNSFVGNGVLELVLILGPRREWFLARGYRWALWIIHIGWNSPRNEILGLMPGHVYGDICTPSFIYIHYIPKDDTRLNIRGHQPFWHWEIFIVKFF